MTLSPMINPYTKEPIAPLMNKPALVRMGGKKYLSKRICERLNAINHSLYVEPFFGGGRIFFEKEPAFMALINDSHRLIANFNYAVKQFPEEFFAAQTMLVKDENVFFDLYDAYHDAEAMRRLKDTIARQKKIWERWGDEGAKGALVDAAADFYFYCNMAYRGSQTARTMTYPENDPRTETNRIRWRIFRECRWMADRLRNTTVMNQDFERVIKRALTYTNHTIAFFLDPPYPETEEYEAPFGWDDLYRLRACLDLIRPPHYFILTLNPLEKNKEIFHGFNIEVAPTVYTTGGNGQRKEVEELIITPTWDPPKKRGAGPLDNFFLKKNMGGG